MGTHCGFQQSNRRVLFGGKDAPGGGVLERQQYKEQAAVSMGEGYADCPKTIKSVKDRRQERNLLYLRGCPPRTSLGRRLAHHGLCSLPVW
jgi:hypothetical protein